MTTSSPSPSSTQKTPLELPADFGSRFSALMIDAALLFAVQWVVVAVLSRQLQAMGMTSQEECSFDPAQLCEVPNSGLAAVLTVLVIGSTIGYHALFEGGYGATPGKYWMGLRVQGTEGLLPIGLARGTARSVVRQAFWIVLFLLLNASPLGVSVPSPLFILLPILALGAVASAAFTRDNRGAHDHLAKTVVVRVKPLGSDDDSADANFDGPLWSDPNQPEELPEHLVDLDQVEDLTENPDLDREESL